MGHWKNTSENAEKARMTIPYILASTKGFESLKKGCNSLGWNEKRYGEYLTSGIKHYSEIKEVIKSVKLEIIEQ
jgi:hypothetical protein